LNDKYTRTKPEKLKEVLKEILEFDFNKEDTCEKYWDKFYSLMNRIKTENLQEHLNYLMCNLMVDKAVKKDKISASELTRLREVLKNTDEEGKRQPKDNKDIKDCLKFEYKN
jgi:hypothetical protein